MVRLGKGCDTHDGNPALLPGFSFYSLPFNGLVTMVYDAADRLTNRTIPAFTYAQRSQGLGANPGPPYPAWAIPVDSQKFFYTPDGLIERANSKYARVKRVYSPQGRVLTDTLRISNEPATSFTQHVYETQHRYDRNGRQRALRPPPQLVRGTGGIPQT